MYIYLCICMYTHRFLYIGIHRLVRNSWNLGKEMGKQMENMLLCRHQGFENSGSPLWESN